MSIFSHRGENYPLPEYLGNGHLFMPFQIKALPIESIDILVEFGFVLDTMF